MRRLRRHRVHLALFLLLAAVLVLSPASAHADFSLTITSPNGYVIIAGGTVVVGVAVVIGSFYFFGRGRVASAPEPVSHTAFLDPHHPPEPSGQAKVILDFFSVSF